MAETDTKTAEKSSKAIAKDEAPEGGALTFAVSDLVARAPEYLGVQQHIAAGGLAGQTNDLTIDGALAAIKSWLDKPVTGD